jgi:plasmid stabilization system protein ParE
LIESLYSVSGEAQDDLFEIWVRIAQDSVRLADRIEDEFRELFTSLGRMPGQGHSRRDLTRRPVLFFPLYSFLVVYQHEVQPVRIMAVLRGRRNLKRILKERLPVPPVGEHSE